MLKVNVKVEVKADVADILRAIGFILWIFLT